MRGYARPNQVFALVESDVILTLAGTLLLVGFGAIVIAAVLDGTRKGLAQPLPVNIPPGEQPPGAGPIQGSDDDAAS
jgi:hypothetical protein